MSLNLADTSEIAVINAADLDPHETITRRLTPPHLRRPRFFRGTRRWTRSRALLVAATWPGGLR
ncbi:hypothetical protein ACTOB_001359 [Actinoplanes oblitus]|uniref:Uncharacterized protein n=1 Tax=Actinoplanes oblitus TaxID=3040509 RepID=A0ABY8WLS7_9ACTN|nr:hypothetical protein [Actinoplanes oblitus]WIM97805.1 hypothetical protein ACTOB_001359 [Actinoplanes oblitus]